MRHTVLRQLRVVDRIGHIVAETLDGEWPALCREQQRNGGPVAAIADMGSVPVRPSLAHRRSTRSFEGKRALAAAVIRGIGNTHGAAVTHPASLRGSLSRPGSRHHVCQQPGAVQLAAADRRRKRRPARP
jgi:hypothetical protein